MYERFALSVHSEAGQINIPALCTTIQQAVWEMLIVEVAAEGKQVKKRLTKPHFKSSSRQLSYLTFYNFTRRKNFTRPMSPIKPSRNSSSIKFIPKFKTALETTLKETKLFPPRAFIFVWDPIIHWVSTRGDRFYFSSTIVSSMRR